MRVDLVQVVWPFVNDNINSSDWHFKEAAIMVFGCLLQGPDPYFMADIVKSGTSILLGMVLSDPSIAVRDSAAWVLSQICARFLQVIPSELTHPLLDCLVAALDMQPRVAQHAATALSAVCDGVANSPSSELLQPYLEVLLNKLLDCAQRMGSASNQLRESAAYALMSLIACAGPGSEELLVGFYQFVLQQSENVLAGQAPGSDMEQAFLLQRFYCIALVALLERLKNLMKIEVDRIATLALRVGEKAESEA